MKTKAEIEAYIGRMYNPDGKDSLIYQCVDVGDIHIPGRRGRKRVELMENEDLADKSVLDVGCSFGMFCFEAAKRGAAYVLGIDNSSQHAGGDVIEACRMLAEYAGLEIDFQGLVINSDAFHSHVGHRIFDVVYCFAIIEHIPNIAAFWTYINSHARLMYFESNISKGRKDVEPILRENTTFSDIEYLGQSADTDPVPSFRVFYRCTGNRLVA